MKILVPVFAFVLSFTLFLPTLSGASNGVPHSYRQFSHFDINGDGSISVKRVKR